MNEDYVLLILIVLGYLAFRPRLDRTKEGWVLLWYGRNDRKYIKLFRL